MEALQAILTRRSVRRYASQPVPDELIRELLQAGMNAPSAGNERPWQFVVIRERATLDAIPTFHPYADMLRMVTVAILVCGDSRLEKFKDHWIYDCAAATENILVAAHAMGLGAVWLAVEPEKPRVDGIRKLTGLPPEVHPFCLVPVGYPEEAIPYVDRYDPARIHYERW